jgi:hypothetical protein
VLDELIARAEEYARNPNAVSENYRSAMEITGYRKIDPVTGFDSARLSENRHEGHILISDCCLTSLKREREIETSKDHKDREKPAESRRKS